MTFIHPWLLWALPASLIPVILHLLFFRRSRKIRMGSIMLLKEAYLKNLPRSRLSQWLLIILRCLAVAALVCSFARPIISSGPALSMLTAASSGEPVGLVALADVSYSMKYTIQGEEYGELAKKAGLSALGVLGNRDKIAVAGFSDRESQPVLEWSSDAARARQSLEAMKPGFNGTDYFRALDAAYNFLSGQKGMKKAIMVLSDSAAHGFSSERRGPEDSPSYDPGVKLLGLEWPFPRENAWAASVSLGGGNLFTKAGSGSAGSSPSIDCVFDISQGARDGWPVRLFRDSSVLFESRLGLTPGTDGEISYKLPGGSKGWIVGRAELKPDNLAADDSFYFVFRMPDKISALCVYDDPSFMNPGRGGYFLSKMLGSGTDSLLPVACQFAEISRLPEIRLQDYRIIILSGFAGVGAAHARILEDYVSRGGGLFVVPDINTTPPGLVELDKLLPAEISGPEKSDSALQPAGSEAGNGLPASAKADGDRSLQAGRFRWAEYELSKIKTGRIFQAVPKKDSKIIWWFDDGRQKRPALILRNFSGGRVMLWCSALDPSWSSIALKPVFGPWLASLSAELAGGEMSVESDIIASGRPFESVRLPSSSRSKVTVTSPDGATQALPVMDGKFVFTGTSRPGIYTWTGEGALREKGYFAVNVDVKSGESDLTPAARVPWQKIRVFDAAADFAKAIRGAEAASAGFLIALALLFAEGLLSRKIY